MAFLPTTLIEFITHRWRGGTLRPPMPHPTAGRGEVHWVLTQFFMVLSNRRTEVEAELEAQKLEADGKLFLSSGLKKNLGRYFR